MEKECLECGDKFEGRIDKKFCCDQCRNTYNNRAHRTANNICRNINRILRNNRKILEDFLSSKKYKTTRERLVNAGFNFDYLTNVYKTQNGTVYYFCYDYGYVENENNTIKIIERKEYVD